MGFFTNLKCAVFGHKFRAHQAFTLYSRRIVCDCCSGDFAENDNLGLIIKWSKECDDFYTSFGYDVRPVKKLYSTK